MRKLILWLMQPQKQNRPQTVAEIRKYLSEGSETFVGNSVNGNNDDIMILEPSNSESYNGREQPNIDNSDIENKKQTPLWVWLIVIAIVVAVIILGFKACGSTKTMTSLPLTTDSDSVAVIDAVYADTAAVDTADILGNNGNDNESNTNNTVGQQMEAQEKSDKVSQPVARDIRPRTVSVGRSVTTQYHRWTLVSLELHDDLTIAHFRVTSRTADTGIWNEGNERIIDRVTGRSYRIMDSNGIGTPSNPTYLPYSGQTVSFEEFFPAIANGTRSV